MSTTIGNRTFELAQFKKLPEGSTMNGRSSVACYAVQAGLLDLATNPLDVYTFRKVVEEYSSDGRLEDVERTFKAYRCQYPGRDRQPLCRGCRIRNTSNVFVEKLQL